ncbi:MAG: flagellar basal body-associated FliL family protein [Pseudomonadota bacterium]
MSKKIIIILSIVGFILVAGLGAGFFIMWSKISQLGAPPPEKEVAEVAVVEEKVPKLGPMMALNPFVVNLAESGGSRYLRMTVELELSEEPVRSEIMTRLPQIRDAVLMILPNKTLADINSSDGKETLREELITAFNEILSKGEIKNIYYTEFVVQ